MFVYLRQLFSIHFPICFLGLFESLFIMILHNSLDDSKCMPISYSDENLTKYYDKKDISKNYPLDQTVHFEGYQITYISLEGFLFSISGCLLPFF